jgi:hypothetical protein
MKLDSKASTVLAAGGIILAGVFFITAIVSPTSLDGILHPSDERNERIKREMERQKMGDTPGQPDARPRRAEETMSDATTPMPLPEKTVRPGEGELGEAERMPKLDCISRDQVVQILGASEEARENRVVGISVTPDGRRIMVSYRKKTFLGIGSGENQIERILRRGLRTSYPDRLIKSVRVQSDGNRSVRRGDQDLNVEILVIESRQAGCQWP